jgi:hypothetical protein
LIIKIIIIFFFKKKKRKSGVASATPTVGLGVVEQPPWPRGWSGHPQKAKKEEEEEKRMGFGFLGWPNYPQGPGGSHPLRPVWGWLQALGGGSTIPKNP